MSSFDIATIITRNLAKRDKKRKRENEEKKGL